MRQVQRPGDGAFRPEPGRAVHSLREEVLAADHTSHCNTGYVKLIERMYLITFIFSRSQEGHEIMQKEDRAQNGNILIDFWK